MSRRIYGCVLWLALAPGCAWIFQEHLSGTYATDTEPACTSSPAWWIADGLLALADAAVTIVDARVAHRTDDDDAALAIAAAGAAGHAASAITGAIWAHTCSTARAEAGAPTF